MAKGAARSRHIRNSSMIASQDPTGSAAVVQVTSPQRVWRLRGHLFLVWCLFFLICFGLGYPTLSRYQPRNLEGLSDSAAYYQLVLGGEVQRPLGNIFAGRVLVPYFARPFYRAARGHLGTWDPVYFGLLVANSIFCATTALVLSRAGLLLTNDAGVALLGATLYLLNFAVPNLQLAGLVDSGEACFMMLLAWALLLDKWWLLPLLGIGGVLAKETFMPLAGLFSIAWWLIAERRGATRLKKLSYVAAMIILSSVTTSIIQLGITGELLAPWRIAVVMASRTNYLRSFFSCISEKEFWGVFIWLLPLGLWRWRRLARPWLVATLATAVTVLLLGAYRGMGGNVARPLFSVAGPMLALSTAMLLRNGSHVSRKALAN